MDWSYYGLLQLEIFEASLLFGGIMGALYDVFRIIRLFFRCKFWNIFIQDVIYFFILGVSTFLFILFINSGEIRFYILAGEIIGWIIYYITLGSLIYNTFNKFSKIIKKFFAKIFKFLLVPLNKLMTKIRLSCLKKNIYNSKI